MTRYLLDTNHASAMLRGNTAFRERMVRLQEDRFFLCIPSIGELYFMVFNSARAQENRERLESLLSGFEIASFDLPASVEFGRIVGEQRQIGKPIPSIDAQIAAIARLNDLVLLTADSHFDNVANLRHENWLTP